MAIFDDIMRGCLPQWSRAEFVFLENEPWWASSVQAELSSTSSLSASVQPTKEMCCISVNSDRAVLDHLDRATPAGIIIFAGHHMRECLLLLGRLGRLCRPTPPILVVIPANAEAMIPLLLESGASSVYVERVSDIRVAGWCRRAAG